MCFFFQLFLYLALKPSISFSLCICEYFLVISPSVTALELFQKMPLWLVTSPPTSLTKPHSVRFYTSHLLLMLCSLAPLSHSRSVMEVESFEASQRWVTARGNKRTPNVHQMAGAPHNLPMSTSAGTKQKLVAERGSPSSPTPDLTPINQKALFFNHGSTLKKNS